MSSIFHPWTRRLGVAALALAFGCDPAYSNSDDEPIDLEARSLVGTVDGTDVALGVLLDGDTVALYSCGGDETFETHTRWFRGTIGTDADANAFEIETDGFTVTGIRTEDGLEGEWVDPDGTTYAFTVDPVAEGSDAGVYIAEHDGRSAGVVVRDEGGTLTAQGASCQTSPRECFQVIILAPLTVRDDNIAVQIDVGGALQDFDVTRTLDPSGV